MYRILAVDDEPNIRTIIRKYAEFEGHSVAEASDGDEAVEQVKKGNFDIVVLDVMMPRMDGFTACGKIREFSDIPVIMLTAKSEEYDKIRGFGLGIDDYVVKPFSPKELMLRVDAVMHRAKRYKNRIISFFGGGLKIDADAKKVFVNGEKVSFTPKAYDLLFLLVMNKNRAVTRDFIIEKVWGFDFPGDERTLDTHIRYIRNNLGIYSGHIVTVRGTGYRFDEEGGE